MNPTIKRSTLADVATLAGVSLGSASRALSVPDEVKPATLAKVNQAVAQLGYVRNGAAQALASKRTRTIAAIYPSLDNPIFASSVNALQKRLWKDGYQLLIASHEYDVKRELFAVRTMIERGVDGIILVGTDHDPAIFDMLSRRQIPHLLTWSSNPSSQSHSIGFSNHQAAYEMARLVLAKGHQKIAICSGLQENNERAKARLLGALQAINQAGYSVPENYRVEEPLTLEGGRLGFNKLWALEKRPTVIIFGNDLQAMGAIDQARQIGLRIPEDLSITGFDDNEMAALFSPALTTVHVPIHEIGIQAAEFILKLVQQESHDVPLANIALSTEVVERKSLGSPRST